MLPHSRSNATARYMSRTQPTCTRLACRTPAHTHTHTPPQGAARKESWKKGTHTGREGIFRQELSIEQDKVQHKAQFKFVPQHLFFSFSGSLEYRHTMQTAKRVYRQRCYKMQTKEMANQGWRKETRMEKKKEKKRAR